MKTLSFALACSFFLAACQYRTHAQIAANHARHQDHDYMREHLAYSMTGDTAENSLDWAGLYVGHIPCPECDSIRIDLELRPDKTYHLQEQHLTENRIHHQQQFTGRFEFDARQPSLIRLDAQAAQRIFFIGEGYAEARNRQTGAPLSNERSYRIAQIKAY
ncbi:copper resistance protein NlpE N-terminal domain-containing protein [Vitreoscilla stercoraria]|uniref:Copper resistance protein NlpE N-terminal domain-containing protein n=1 Tax=Vitreoscilla stercoraria TaxID=61 RepID=A0ABY4E7A1_VITST|nr:copper resistance protein NlpE N-terminal domain-containing protein [Vitreoscilla stercoraria]UOO91636.1 copper resistance protein NlpE N-terminal domain-containing protein [Vitreoscilla stercoraria]